MLRLEGHPLEDGNLARVLVWHIPFKKGVDVFELSASEQALTSHSSNTLFHPSEAQLSEVMKRLRIETLQASGQQMVAFPSWHDDAYRRHETSPCRFEILSA